MVFSLHKKTRRTIRLVCVTFFYLLFGAFMFGYLEHETDVELRQDIKISRNKLQQKYNFTKEDFEKLETTIVDMIPHSAGRQWRFTGSLFFCVIVITTVGYGHSTPCTFTGKLFYILFAFIGIPLGLVTFQSSGERINHSIKICLLKLRLILAKCGIYVLKEVKARHLLVVSLSLGITTIIVGTLVFHKQENWTLFDISTIGLGDRVAAQTEGRLENDPFYVIFTLMFILGGLAIFSACVNLLILQFMATNPDVVTARSKIKRLLQRSTSFRSTTFNSFSSTSTRNQKSSGIKKTANNEKKEASEKRIKSMYFPYRQNPIKFSVRRPASIYIDHLVYTQTSKI
ncbi:hypothetical protein M3Y97_00237600 [Aphelenchoides bicaudatus]|nr:hypothetical protein M3Y97_00237600 [Aphelenchoides bicaudatus]